MNHQSKGFTLIELLIVIAIISLLATTLIPNLLTARAKADDGRRKASLKSLQTEIANQTDVGLSGYSNIFSSGEVSNKLNKLIADTGVSNGTYDAVSDATSYAIVFPLKQDPTKYWCVDSTGVSKEVSGRINATGTKSCGNISVPPAIVSCPAAFPVGNVWYDANGLTDGEVNQNGSSWIPNSLNAYLVDSNTNLITDVGWLQFSSSSSAQIIFDTTINPGTYYLRLSTLYSDAGSPPPAAYVGSGKQFSGEFSGSGPGSDGLVDGTLNMQGCTNNFGIQNTGGGGDIVTG